MDIKLKNSIIFRLCLFIYIILLGFSSIVLIDIIKNNKFLNDNFYFNTYEFKKGLVEYFSYVHTLNTEFKGYDAKSPESKVTEEEIAAQKKVYDYQFENMKEAVTNGYLYQINKATEENNNELKDKLIKERDLKIENARSSTARSIEEITSQIRIKKDKDYNNFLYKINYRSDVKYYLMLSNHQVFSNLANSSNIDKYLQNNSIYSVKFPQNFESNPTLNTINTFFKNMGAEGYLIVPKGAENLSNSSYQFYHGIYERLVVEVIYIALFIILMVCIVAFLRKKMKSQLHSMVIASNKFNKLPLELNIAILAVAAIFLVIYSLSFSFFEVPLILNHIVLVLFTASYMFYLIFDTIFFIRIIKSRNKLGELWNNCLSYKLYSLIKECLKFKETLFKTTWLTLLTIIYGFFLGISLTLRTSDILIFIILITILYLFTVFINILSKLRHFNRILLGTKDIVMGDFSSSIESTGKGGFSKLAENINNMSEGFKKSLDSQVKSEKLRAELITNVSHDLKTPLTSIINYVDLLKKEDLSSETFKEYIAVLDKKSQRMNVLIEDLFEASKLSSGSVELSLERIDVGALLHQALAEFDEKIKSSSLKFVINVHTHKVFSKLDGKKIWRVFENLISNILKYSQINTRVFIELKRHKNKAVLTMKNTSAYELDFNPEELFERFKRGDQSRNTEGSGLGLAIAKSIVDLHGGRLLIDIDGDLFKVLIEFDLSEE